MALPRTKAAVRRIMLLAGAVVVVLAGMVSPAAAADGVVPARITIPRIGVDAPVQQVGLRKSGEMEVPKISERNLTGWYKYGPVPGDLGPAVIVGHVATRTGPSVFARLRELRRGDTVTVTRTDGTSVTFVVNNSEQALKRRFPTQRVYGDISHVGLRLITCGGMYDRKTRSYTGNLIVYATAQENA
ncbi:class F sortase [Nonomuraea endophytica]|uniref:class F sortase n=1 Tax=Nonomuraea endophytica TaxID=714136 RepID=UPI0037C75E08